MPRGVFFFLSRVLLFLHPLGCPDTAAARQCPELFRRVRNLGFFFQQINSSTQCFQKLKISKCTRKLTRESSQTFVMQYKGMVDLGQTIAWKQQTNAESVRCAVCRRTENEIYLDTLKLHIYLYKYRTMRVGVMNTKIKTYKLFSTFILKNLVHGHVILASVLPLRIFPDQLTP